MAENGKILERTISGILANQFHDNQSALSHAFEDYGKTIGEVVTTKNGERIKLPPDQLKGFIAEAHHVASFNIHARTKRIPQKYLHAKLSDYGNPTSDIHIHSVHGQKNYQLKYGKTAQRTANALSVLEEGKPKYKEGKVGPSEQVEQIQAYSKKRAHKEKVNRPEVSKAHQHTQETVSSYLEEAGVQSDPLTDKSAKRIAEQAQNGKSIEYGQIEQKWKEFCQSSLVHTVKVEGVSAVLQNAITELVQLCQKKKLSKNDFSKAFVHIAQDTADRMARAAIRQTALNVAANRRPPSVKLAPHWSIFHTHAITIGIDVIYDFSKAMFQFVRGKLDGDEFLSSSIQNTWQTSGVAIGNITGQTLFIKIGASLGAPLGPIGTTIGAASGALLTLLGINKLISVAKKEGHDRFLNSFNILDRDLNQVPDIYQYIETAGAMSHYKFSFKHLIPCYAMLGTLSEYRARKQALQEIEKQLFEQKQHLDVQHLNALKEICQQHKACCKQLEYELSVQSEQFRQHIGGVQNDFQAQIETYLVSRQAAIKLNNTVCFQELTELGRESQQITNRLETLDALQSAIGDLRGAVKLINNDGDREQLFRFLNELLKGKLLKNFDAPIDQAHRFFRKVHENANHQLFHTISMQKGAG